jgi:hypothetical protein
MLPLALSLLAFAEEPGQSAPPAPPAPSEAPAQAAPAPTEAPAAPSPPSTPPPETSAAPLNDLDLLRNELAVLKAEVAAMKAPAPGAPAFPLTFQASGYYRARAHLFGGLGTDGKTGSYINQRIRTRLTMAYKDIAKFNVDIQALDDVVFGDNNDNASTALFAGNPSLTGWEGLERPPVEFLRAWIEAKTPVGVIRVGRQPSMWGTGILINHGDGFDDDFGENHYGTSFDRILFATNPAAIINKIRGKENKIPLTLAVAYDHLVEDPLTQYYGFECESGIREDDPKYDPRCDANLDGLTDVAHDFTEERASEDRAPDWWRENVDDVHQMAYALIYRGEKQDWIPGKGDLTAGVTVIQRWQDETNSNVWVPDVYLYTQMHGIFAEFEGVGIIGDTSGIALKGSFDPNAEDADPLFRQARIGGAVGRLGYKHPLFKVTAETGWASGDANVTDSQFTGRSLHPDHNVGLLLYEEVISRVTARLWTDNARGLWSQGGVYNSVYLNPRVSFFPPIKGTEVIAGFVTAWPDKPDGRFIRCLESEGCSSAGATKSALGWEADLAIKAKWAGHLNFTLEGAYAKTTDRLPVEAAGMNADGEFFTVQSRLAWEF